MNKNTRERQKWKYLYTVPDTCINGHGKEEEPTKITFKCSY